MISMDMFLKIYMLAAVWQNNKLYGNYTLQKYVLIKMHSQELDFRSTNKSLPLNLTFILFLCLYHYQHTHSF